MSASSLEIEIAVARGDAYLYRARFRPATILTVGSNPMTTINISGEDVPDFHELLRLSEDGALLRFTPDVRVDMLGVGGVVLSNDALIDQDIARPSGEGYALRLESGSKVVVRMGLHKLMLKVEPLATAAVRALKLGATEDARCPSCGRIQSLALTTGGAITVCEGCGAFTQFLRAGGAQAQLEAGATQIGVSSGLAIGASSSARASMPPPPSHDDLRGADLPTFDAIQVFKEDEGLKTMDAVSALRGSPQKEPAPSPPKKPKSIGPKPSSRPPPPDKSTPAMTSRGADLPTYDAISAIKDGGMNTMDAVTALRGGVIDGPPPARKDETPANRPGRPVNIADMVKAQEPQVSKEPVRPPPPPPSREVPKTREPQVSAPPPKALESGHWEETVTLRAVHPKKNVNLVWIAVGALGFGMAFAFLAIYIAIRQGWMSF